MIRLGLMLALAGLLSAPALAEGLTGQVVSLHTGKPIAHATIYYYKTPYVESAVGQVRKLSTDATGHFADITLPPGRYILMARIPGKVQGCAVDDVMGGETTHVRIEIGHSTVMCSGPRMHPTLLDPNATASVYRI